MSTADDAFKGYGTAAAVTGTVLAAAAAAAPAATAAAAVAIGAAVGTAIPVPLLGTAIGATIGAITALGITLAEVTKDSFHPTPQQAAALLMLMRLDPALLFTGIDNATSPEQGARLARYFRLVSGEVPSTGPLYNPISNDSCDNPYMCRVDPTEPLTDPAFLKPIYDAVRKIGNYTIKGSDGSIHTGGWVAPGQHVDLNGDAASWPVGVKLDFPDGTQWRMRSAMTRYGLFSTDATWDPSGQASSSFTQFIPSDIKTPADAKTILGVLRTNINTFGDTSQWSQIAQNLGNISAEIKAVRLLAGEDGLDPVLGHVFGDVSVKTTPALTRAANAPTPLSTSGVWGAAVPVASADSDGWWELAAFSVAVIVIGGVVVWKTRRSPLQLHTLATYPRLDDPGAQAFRRVITTGVMDGDLKYLRSGMPSMLYFHKSFGDAKLLDITPTELAMSGRYFGEEALPIRIEVMPDGSLHLTDGRARYTAAKMAGARAILADVVQYDNEGDVVRDRRVVVNLL